MELLFQFSLKLTSHRGIVNHQPEATLHSPQIAVEGHPGLSLGNYDRRQEFLSGDAGQKWETVFDVIPATNSYHIVVTFRADLVELQDQR